MNIYMVTNLVNGKIYIGQDSKNKEYYYGSGKAIIRSIKKYGKENFKKEILESVLTIEELNEREIYWISKFNSSDRKIGYNISKGGSEGDRQSGYNIVKKGIYQYWVDKYGKEEAEIRLENKKEKLRKQNKKRKDSGWKHSKESIESIREFAKNRIVSDETRRKMSEYRTGMKYSVETVMRMSMSKKDIGNKPILQLSKSGEFIKEWKSQSEVKEILDLGIWNALNGISKTSGGYKWEYKK